MIRSIHIKNFKAISEARLKLTPLTALIGYNGSGKSSVLEALETFQTIVTEGLDKAIMPWRAFEHIYYKGQKPRRTFTKKGIKLLYAPMEFVFKTKFQADGFPRPIGYSVSLAQEESSAGFIYFIEEYLRYKEENKDIYRNADNRVKYPDEKLRPIKPDSSIIADEYLELRFIQSWQFLSMNTFLMGNPTAQKKTSGAVKLNKDGSNIAEYLLSIRDISTDAFDSIIETLQLVLPYAQDIQPAITQEFEKMVYLQLSEQDFKVPGWLFSTGTLKIPALLAVLRHPERSSLIVIEEIENGLDPGTIHLIVDEIRDVVKTGSTQVIITTHSPYLLDLLHLSQVVFVERKDDKVAFNRPYDFEQLRIWSKEYTPGELYRKDMLQQIMK